MDGKCYKRRVGFGSVRSSGVANERSYVLSPRILFNSRNRNRAFASFWLPLCRGPEDCHSKSDGSLIWAKQFAMILGKLFKWANKLFNVTVYQIRPIGYQERTVEYRSHKLEMVGSWSGWPISSSVDTMLLEQDLHSGTGSSLKVFARGGRPLFNSTTQLIGLP